MLCLVQSVVCNVWSDCLFIGQVHSLGIDEVNGHYVCHDGLTITAGGYQPLRELERHDAFWTHYTTRFIMDLLAHDASGIEDLLSPAMRRGPLWTIWDPLYARVRRGPFSTRYASGPSCTFDTWDPADGSRVTGHGTWCTEHRSQHGARSVPHGSRLILVHNNYYK